MVKNSPKIRTNFSENYQFCKPPLYKGDLALQKNLIPRLYCAILDM